MKIGTSITRDAVATTARNLLRRFSGDATGDHRRFKFAAAISLTLAIPLALSLAAPSSAADKYLYDWEKSVCARAIGQWKDARVHDIYRLRPRLNSAGSKITLEIGDPNFPKTPTPFPAWVVNMSANSKKEKSLWHQVATAGAWVVFKADGTSGDLRLKQGLFWNAGGKCDKTEPTTAAGNADMPDDVITFFRSASDTVSAEAQSPARQEFGGATDDNNALNQETGGNQHLGREADAALSLPADEAEKIARLSEMFPQAFLPKLVTLYETCSMNGGTATQMDDDFVTRTDVNGDGRSDWVADGRKVHCEIAGKPRLTIGRTHNGSYLWITLNLVRGPVLLDDIAMESGVVRRHANFTTISFDGGTDLQIRGTQVSEIRRVPEGGTVVFSVD